MNTNSKWVYGCDREIQVHVPRGFSYKTYTVRCGSTAYDGSVNQCSDCSSRIQTPPVPDYGDIEHMDDLDYRREALDSDCLEDIEPYVQPEPRLFLVTYNPNCSIIGWANSVEQLERFFPGSTYQVLNAYAATDRIIFDLRNY